MKKVEEVKRGNRLKVGFDVDDTIINFTEHILEDIGEDPNAKVEWGFKNFPESIREEAFKKFIDKDFIKNIPVSPELKDFINNLSKKHEVFFVTATYPEAATERILYLKRHFPNVDPGNIIIAGNKSLFDFDIFFDDRFENLSGFSTHNILVNKHWNKGVTRFPIARSLEDMKDIIDMVERGCSKNTIFKTYESKNIKDNSLILIQGHTGSGKNYILDNYLKGSNPYKLKKVTTTTTREIRDGEIDGKSYNFLSKDEFIKRVKNGEFIEYTKYHNNYYGVEKGSIEKVYKEGYRPVMIVDYKGVEAFNEYTNNVIDIYIKRDMETTVKSLYERDGHLDRLHVLFKEIKNIEKNRCRCEILNKGDLEEIFKEFESCIRVV